MLNYITTLKSSLGVTQDHWKMETAPFDRLHTSSYRCYTVTMALSCMISEIKWDI